jgi:tetratricopeptide (TPR) repeat protein
MRRLVLCLLAVACAQAPVRSKDAQSWIELQSDHFLLRTDLPADDARRNIADMEQVRVALLGSGWHSNRDQRGRTIVVQLASRTELEEFARKGVEGFATADVFHQPLIVIHAGEDVLEQQLFKHELTHIINKGFLVSKPRWVDEGIAAYLETLEIKRGRGQAVMGKPDSNRLAYLHRHPAVGWFATVSTGAEAMQDTAEGGYAFETAAWALVHYFVDTKPEAFDQYLTQLARGTDAWRAFNIAFPGLREEDLAAAMTAYLRNGKITLDTLPVHAWKGGAAVRALPPAEVHALRADLLRMSPGYGARPQLVAPEIAKALEADPGNPYALMLKEGGDPKVATAAHPDDWRAWLLAFDRNQEDRQAIDQAMKLAPDEPSVLLRMAFAELHTDEGPRALEHATRAADLAPGRSDALDALAHALAGNGRCDEASAVEQRAVDAVADAAASGVPQEMRDRQRGLRDYCDQRKVASAVGSRQMQLREVKLKSCKAPPPRLYAKSEIRIHFTLGEDGTPRAITIDGAASTAVRSALRKYVESCRYEPVLVDGKPQEVQTSMTVSPASRK